MRDERSGPSGKWYGKISAAALLLIGFLAAGWTTLEIAERAGFVLSLPSAQKKVPVRFSLRNHRDQPVTEQELAGRPALFYFGYTYCPDICPTHLAALLEIVDFLQGDGQGLRRAIPEIQDG